MSAETQLYALLSGYSEITNVVAKRIYPIIVPDKQNLPAIAYQRTGTEYTNTIGNAAVAGKVSFDIYCAAAQYGDAEALGDLIANMPLPIPGSQITKTNRSSAYDPETEMWAAILSVDVWET